MKTINCCEAKASPSRLRPPLGDLVLSSLVTLCYCISFVHLLSLTFRSRPFTKIINSSLSRSLIFLGTTSHQNLIFILPPFSAFRHPGRLSSAFTFEASNPPSIQALRSLSSRVLGILSSHIFRDSSIFSSHNHFSPPGIERPRYSTLSTMSGPISPRDRHAQAPPNRPPLPTACAGLDPSISLCGIPKTEEARKTWQTIIGTIQADLQGLERYNSPTTIPAAIGLG